MLDLEELLGEMEARGEGAEAPSPLLPEPWMLDHMTEEEALELWNEVDHKAGDLSRLEMIWTLCGMRYTMEFFDTLPREVRDVINHSEVAKVDWDVLAAVMSATDNPKRYMLRLLRDWGNVEWRPTG